MSNRDDIKNALSARLPPLIRQQLLFSNTVPYGSLDVPPYRDGATLGRWTLKWQRGSRMVHGYHSGLQQLRNNWILTEKRLGRERIWMSLAPMELESQGYHAAAAKGHTVIIGFGMGVLLYNVLRNPAVQQVTVIERDPAVIRLAEKVIGWRDWHGSEKARITHTPWQDYRMPDGVDVLLADPWPTLGDMNIRPDMQDMIRRYEPKQITGWGVEFDFITWVHEQSPTNSPVPDEGLWDAYSKACFDGRLITPGEKAEYWAFIAVAQQMIAADSGAI